MKKLVIFGYLAIFALSSAILWTQELIIDAQKNIIDALSEEVTFRRSCEEAVKQAQTLREEQLAIRRRTK